MTAAAKSRKWTVEEFFAWHEKQEDRYELVGGYPVLRNVPVRILLEGADAPTMMTGANRRHNLVNSNLSRLVGNQLQGGPCRGFSKDAAVRTTADQNRYPDLVLDCGTMLDDGYILQKAALVADVLSPSTKGFDLFAKVTEYWAIETLKYVLIVDPETRRAQLHSRGRHGAPTLRVFGDLDDSIELPELGISLSLAGMFAGLPPIEDDKSSSA